MKPQFNKSWLWIALIIIANIVIFSFMSNKLESYMTDTLIERNTISGI